VAEIDITSGAITREMQHAIETGVAWSLGEAIALGFDADTDACDSYERNLGHRPMQMDVRDLLRMVRAGWSPGPVDLFVADPPCTPWSRAGSRKGQEDERDMLGVTVELIELLRPQAWLIANVPGLDDSKNWAETVQPVIGGMASRCSYCVDFQRLNAASFGVPQKRVRPFWFGHKIGTPCIEWPHPTHCKPPVLPGCGLKTWVTCRDALDHLPIEELGRPVRVTDRRGHAGHPCSLENEPGQVVPSSMPTNGGAVLMTRGDRRVAGADEVSRVITTKQDDGRLLAIAPMHGHPTSKIDEPAWTITTEGRRAGKRASVVEFVDRLPDPNRAPQPVDAPARTVTAQAEFQTALEWPWDTTSTVVCSGPQLAPTGRNGRDGESQRGNPNAVVLSERAAAILQGFPPDWVFCGKTKRARWSQIGQAMPPPMDEAVGRSIARWRDRLHDPST
jgi:site-specific DNA-cytosine methylase